MQEERSRRRKRLWEAFERLVVIVILERSLSQRASVVGDHDIVRNERAIFYGRLKSLCVMLL